MKKKKKKTTQKKTTARKKTSRLKKGTITLADMAEQIMSKSRKINEKHPAIGRKIQQSEAEIRKHLEKIKTYAMKLSAVERELVTILTINRLENTIEDVLGGKWSKN